MLDVALWSSVTLSPNIPISSALRKKPLKPLLRWAGSKKRQFTSFSAHFPNTYGSYVEPFAGSAAFVFLLNAKGAKINDINSDVTDFYRYSSLDPARFYDEFSTLSRDKITYNFSRDQIRTMPRSHDRSVLFYFLNRNCFNGIYRVNKSGQFNVPFSDSRVSPYPTVGEFEAACELIARTQVGNCDFERFCELNVNKDDFVFLDPPYYSEQVRIFNEYQNFEFGKTELNRLKATLRSLDEVGAKFLLCFPAGDLARDLGMSWNSYELAVRRTVAGNAGKRKSDVEILIKNYE